MVSVLKLVLLVVILEAKRSNSDWVPLPAPFTEHCIVGERNEYNVSAAGDVPWFTVDLDAPPYQRWQQVATAYKTQIKDLIGVIKNLSFAFFHGKLIQWIDTHMDKWDALLPQPYQDELKGIAAATGMPLGEVVLYNIFYEINAVCTSIVAQDNNNVLYHARNLDFGLFLGWNRETHDWAITEMLRPNIINVNWIKGGKTLFKSNNFAGYVGVYNAVKQNVFTLTANERYDILGGYVGIFNWLLGVGHAKWMTWLSREAMEEAASYADAVKMLSETPLMSPCYYIVGGAASGEGTIITRALNKTVSQVNMNLADPNGWYVLETNYDPGTPPLFLDDRRDPGNKCMQQMGRSGAGFEGIYNVLSSTTNYNKLTVYTVMMRVDTGVLETYIRKCPDPCWPW